MRAKTMQTVLLRPSRALPLHQLLGLFPRRLLACVGRLLRRNFDLDLMQRLYHHVPRFFRGCFTDKGERHIDLHFLAFFECVEVGVDELPRYGVHLYFFDERLLLLADAHKRHDRRLSRLLPYTLEPPGIYRKRSRLFFTSIEDRRHQSAPADDIGG